MGTVPGARARAGSQISGPLMGTGTPPAGPHHHPLLQALAGLRPIPLLHRTLVQQTGTQGSLLMTGVLPSGAAASLGEGHSLA